MKEKKCEVCGGIIRDYPSCIGKRKTCSKSCQSKRIWTGKKHSKETIAKMRTSEIWNDLEEITKEYKEGNKTIAEVAKEWKVNANSLKTIFRKEGIKMKGIGARKGRIPWNKGIAYYAIRGEKNPNWKGGITSLNQKIRHCIEYKNWVRAAMKRDDWTCQLCEKRGGDLEVDHYRIKFSDILSENNISSYEDAKKCDELWDISNGRTLCLKCHNKTKLL